jgi:asparagine synthase (glutamine-hydrolysing)
MLHSSSPGVVAMCGIVAIHSEAAPVDPEATAAALASLRHRGPDGSGIWIAADRRVGLGHARLSVIDLEGGRQPLSNENDRVHAVVNGEIYDHDRILDELRALGHRPRSQSDSETIVHLYEEYGVHCLRHLRGEFAFVLWDEANQLLFAARDRFGIKPLYVAFDEGRLLLASEVKALFELGLPARWNRDALLVALRGVQLPSTSLFDRVSALPPGHYLIARAGQTVIRRYWDFDFPLETSDSATIDETEAVERVTRALDEAVRLRLRADVRVGCYLSGGIDSSAILGLATKHHNDSIDTYTIAFEDARFDESTLARATAERHGARMHVLSVNERMLADAFAASVFHAETLAANSHGAAKFLLSGLVRANGGKVVLTGEGADEVFGGYLSLRADALSGGAGLSELIAKNQTMNVLLDTKALERPSDSPRLELVKRVLRFVPSWMQMADRRKLSHLLGADAEARAELNPFALLLAEIDVDGQLAGRERVHQSMYLLARTQLPSYILTVLGDRAEMAHSVEGRVPFLDHVLVETVNRLPSSFKIRGTVEKYVLRHAVRTVVSDEVFGRQKHVFLAPSPRRSGELWRLTNDLLRGSAIARIPYLDPAKVAALLDRLPDMSDADYDTWSAPLFQMMSACALQERFGLT